jgi:hypothetical protein
MRSSLARRILGLALLGMCVWIVVAFYAAAHYYEPESVPWPGWRISQTEGERLPTSELVFELWYAAYGLSFIACLIGALHLLGLTGPLRAGLRRARLEPRLPFALALLIVLGSLLFRRFILLNQVITTDEQSYVFIAQTLLHGRVVNPLPDALGFFDNRQIVLGEHGWYGKYPVGHPLLLALAQLLHLQNGLFALLGGCTALLAWKLGKLTIGPRRALIALVLLALSPQFSWTQATLLSQTTTTFAAVGAMVCLATAGIRGERWFVAAGAALGFGFLARPMPGVLYILVAILFVSTRPGQGLASATRRLALLGGPVLAAGAAMLAVNWIQTGSPFQTGYQQHDGSLNLLENHRGQTGQSLLGAVLRENFWLFGWPVSLAFLPFAWPRRGGLLLWGPVVAGLVYRVAAPKTFVSATGPVYMAETVPFLALLTADGLARLGLLTRRVASGTLWGQIQISAPVASCVAAALMFVPAHAATISAGEQEFHRLEAAIESTGSKQGIVFVNRITEHIPLLWVASPAPPAPDLSDDWLLLRWPETEKNPVPVMTSYWKSHWPDRPAYLFVPDHGSQLIPLQ